MPMKTKPAPAVLPKLPVGLIDLFDEGPKTAHEINATVMALKKALIERALSGEMNHHLGYAPGASKPQTASNQRNGTGAKTVYTDNGPLRLDVPRDREASFEPILIPKHERRFTGFDVRPRHDGTRHSGISAGAVRHARFAGVRQQRHRRGDGRGHGVAEQAA